ncbi:Nucleoredoxin-like protein 2 [Strongyloides ratti]|uniref:protein-disulfide reductase n=1 Tax=Strongyloides ratti TaxID=34506 RepID=A0A090LLV1_STRRB|nr:Nucleoredoxin-like protein 2 [Strongyloides ratti]CEF68540.1 Nucleoredoxin-like protein 2 [Strongyloides ratti]
MNVQKLVNDVDLYRGEENEGKGSSILKGHVVGLYFSAGWCGPCRQFTPKLKRFYENVKKEGKKFEIIFISVDREKEDCFEYYEEKMGKWLMMDYNLDDAQSLKEQCSIQTIPSFKIVKSDGTIVVEDARSAVVDEGSDNPLALFEKWEQYAF